MKAAAKRKLKKLKVKKGENCLKDYLGEQPNCYDCIHNKKKINDMPCLICDLGGGRDNGNIMFEALIEY